MILSGENDGHLDYRVESGSISGVGLDPGLQIVCTGRPSRSESTGATAGRVFLHDNPNNQKLHGSEEQ